MALGFFEGAIALGQALDDGPAAWILQVLQAKRDRIDARRGGAFVHERLDRKYVAEAAERTQRGAAQRCFLDVMVDDQNVGKLVERDAVAVRATGGERGIHRGRELERLFQVRRRGEGRQL